MSPGRIDPTVVRRHVIALDEVLAQLNKYAGAPIEVLRTDVDERRALTQALRPLAGFRNALVHGYLGVDLSIVHAVLNQHLDHVRAFVAAVNQHLAGQGP